LYDAKADRFKANVTQSIAETIAKLPAFETSTTSLGPDGQFTMAIQAKFRLWVLNLNLHPMAPLDKTCAEPLANDSEIVDDRASLFSYQQRTSINYLPPHRALAMAPALASSMGRLINLNLIKFRLNLNLNQI